MGRYISDFLAPSLRLAVEVDGGYHGSKQQRVRDERRDREFRRLGYAVMRFPASEVMCDVDSVVWLLQDAIEALEEQLDLRAGRRAFWEA